MDTFEDYLRKHMEKGITEFKLVGSMRGEVVVSVDAVGYLTEKKFFIVDNNRLVPVK